MVATVALGKPSVRIPKDKKAQFVALTAPRRISVPTIVMAFVVIGGVLAADMACLALGMPMWTGLLLNIVFYYGFFSVIHDGVHRAISSDRALNDRICQLAISIYAPFAAMPIFRWAHMEHHRFTNDEADPDEWCHGPLWQLPFRWMTIDVYYGYRAIISKNPNVKRVLSESLPFMVGGLAFLTAIVALGYGYELLMLWFIPSRLAFIGIGYAFFWLPHSHWPDEDRALKQSENFTLATLLRIGNERLMNPLLQYQNYHLIHHLWPTTPFYNNERVYRLLEEEMGERDLAIVRGLSTRPDYRDGMIRIEEA
jgi:beta-carotene hydroxylase